MLGEIRNYVIVTLLLNQSQQNFVFCAKNTKGIFLRKLSEFRLHCAVASTFFVGVVHSLTGVTTTKFDRVLRNTRRLRMNKKFGLNTAKPLR